MPSLKDLAKECGVSVATVSKALNDQPDIAPATRERIRAAARSSDLAAWGTCPTQRPGR